MSYQVVYVASRNQEKVDAVDRACKMLNRLVTIQPVETTSPLTEHPLTALETMSIARRRAQEVREMHSQGCVVAIQKGFYSPLDPPRHEYDIMAVAVITEDGRRREVFLGLTTDNASSRRNMALVRSVMIALERD